MKKYLQHYIEMRLEHLRKDKQDLINSEALYWQCSGQIEAYEDILNHLKHFL